MKAFLIAALAASAGSGAWAAEPVPPPREPPSNTQAGVAVDRYIGNANTAPARVALDTMLTRTILRAGDPQKPGDPGAVLLYRKEIALNTLQPGETTSLGRSEDQFVFYVEEGEARLDDGKSYWAIKPGVMILAPAGVGHRFSVVGDKALKMISVQIPVEPGVKPKTEMIVRDVTKMALTERNVHWSNMTKYVFLGERDGLFASDRVYVVYMAPMTIAGPHAHSPGQEEVWIKASEGRSIMQLGSEIRDWPINAGFVAPPNGQTVHAAFNLDDHVQAWFYVARLNPNPASNPPAPNPNRPPPPTAIAEGLAASNIAPTPLPAAGKR